MFPDPQQPAAKSVPGIPWFPGITVLQAMSIADSIIDTSFTFRVVYASFYGAFVDMIDGVPDANGNYWILYIDGVQASTGVSEAIIVENTPGANVDIEWKFENPGAVHQTVAKEAAAKLVGK